MPPVKFLPAGTTRDFPSGTNLLEAIHAAHLEIDSSCGGVGTCGKCLVRVISGDVTFERPESIDSALAEQGYVLACKSFTRDCPLILEIPNQELLKGGQFAEQQDETALIQRTHLPENWQFSGLTRQISVTVFPAQLEDGLSDVDRFTRSIQSHIGPKKVHIPLGILRQLAEVLRQNEGKVNLTVFDREDTLSIIHITSAPEFAEYGLAVDIGTTSIAVQLIAIPSAKIIATLSDYNDQIKCGQDVISRINFAHRSGGLHELQSRALKTINRLISSLLTTHQIAADAVCSAVFSGNTTMLHLFLGLPPEYIRLEPYTPTINIVPNYSASELGIAINPQAVVYCSPSVGSYVGGDITAGLLCTDLDHHEELSLFIDIGTNGELVVGNKDFLMTCACSAGPTFEGAGFDCGMRAVRGAIDQVTVDAQTSQVTYHVIGDCAPKGLCGTGVISLLGQLFLTGWIDAAGKLDRSRPSPYIELSGRSGRFLIVPADKSGTGHNIDISESEITNIIRSKAAIYSAVALIMQKVELPTQAIRQVYIGGNFGRFLDVETAITIGLLPDLPLTKFTYLGNSSLIGSYLLLVSQEARTRQAELTKKLTYLELNTEQAYMDQYSGALFLPHTDLAAFPTVQQKMHKK
jgi:uncharacterized 2Fe-2S/4Fe-4S cluster protein (DUF4445 family)